VGRRRHHTGQLDQRDRVRVLDQGGHGIIDELLPLRRILDPGRAVQVLVDLRGLPPVPVGTVRVEDGSEHVRIRPGQIHELGVGLSGLPGRLGVGDRGLLELHLDARLPQLLLHEFQEGRGLPVLDREAQGPAVLLPQTGLVVHRPSGLVEEFRGAVGVVAQQVGDVLVIRRGPGQQRRRRLLVPREQRPQLVAVDGLGQGLADAFVGEERPGLVEDQVVDDPRVRPVEDLVVRGLEEFFVLGLDHGIDVDLVGGQAPVADGRFGDDRHVHGVEVGRTRMVCRVRGPGVVIEPVEVDALSRSVFREPEGPGAHDVAPAPVLGGFGQRGVGVETEGHGGCRLEELGVGFVEVHRDGSVIGCPYVRQARQVGGPQAGLGPQVLDRPQIVLDGLGGEIRSVLERDPVPEVERELGRVVIHVPRFREPGLQLAGIGVLVGQRVGDLSGHVEGDVLSGLLSVHAPGIRVEGKAERSPGDGGVRGVLASGVLGGSAPGQHEQRAETESKETGPPEMRLPVSGRQGHENLPGELFRAS
jgi:hypothetical protein